MLYCVNLTAEQIRLFQPAPSLPDGPGGSLSYCVDVGQNKILSLSQEGAHSLALAT